jgi:inhibitor of KinA sporulation pathway (predicted exonuclease)
MAKACELVGLTLAGTHHRALDDALNIARLLPWILGEHSGTTNRETV